MEDNDGNVRYKDKDPTQLLLMHDQLSFKGSNDEAFACICQALKMLESDPASKSLYSRALGVFSHDLMERGEVENAKRALEESIAVDRSLVAWNPELELIHLEEYSRLLVGEGKTIDSAALESDFILRALEDLRRSGNLSQEKDRSKVLERRHDVKRLAKSTQDAIGRRYGYGSDQHLYSILLSTRVIYGFNEVPEALATLNYGLEAAHYTKNINRVSYLLLLGALADIHFRSDDFIETEKAINQELTLIQKIYGDNSEQMANCYSKLSRLYQVQGDLKKAEGAIQSAIAIDEANDPMNIAKQDRLMTLLDLIAKQDEHDRIIRICRKTIATIEKLGSESSNRLPELYVRMGESYLMLEKFDKAMDAIKKGLTLTIIFGDVHSPICRRGLADLVNLYGKVGDVDKMGSVQANPLLKT